MSKIFLSFLVVNLLVPQSTILLIAWTQICLFHVGRLLICSPLHQFARVNPNVFSLGLVKLLTSLVYMSSQIG